MEMTLKRLGLTDLKGILTSATMPLGILMLVAMMVLPLQSFFDTFFVSNILISLVILMVSLQTYRPLDFSSFPVFC